MAAARGGGGSAAEATTAAASQPLSGGAAPQATMAAASPALPPTYDGGGGGSAAPATTAAASRIPPLAPARRGGGSAPPAVAAASRPPRGGGGSPLSASAPPPALDPADAALDRLIAAATECLPPALEELYREGIKTSCWSWYAFPNGLKGTSDMHSTYLTEATAVKFFASGPRALWQLLLERVSTLVRQRGSTLDGTLPEADWHRVQRFCHFWSGVSSAEGDDWSWLREVISVLAPAADRALSTQRGSVLAGSAPLHPARQAAPPAAARHLDRLRSASALRASQEEEAALRSARTIAAHVAPTDGAGFIPVPDRSPLNDDAARELAAEKATLAEASRAQTRRKRQAVSARRAIARAQQRDQAAAILASAVRKAERTPSAALELELARAERKRQKKEQKKEQKEELRRQQTAPRGGAAPVPAPVSLGHAAVPPPEPRVDAPLLGGATGAAVPPPEPSVDGPLLGGATGAAVPTPEPGASIPPPGGATREGFAGGAHDAPDALPRAPTHPLSIPLTVEVYPTNMKWILAAPHLRRHGFKFLDSDDDTSGLIDPNFGLHPVRHGGDGLPYLDGILTDGMFTVCARGLGTTEMLVDTGANVTASGPGWEKVLTLQSQTGRNAACPGSASLISAGQAALVLVFPAPTTFVRTSTEAPAHPSCSPFAGAAISSIVQAHDPAPKERKGRTPGESTRGRHAMISSAEDLHQRLGITSTSLMRALATSAVGVGKIGPG